jgi:hypothetical protein
MIPKLPLFPTELLTEKDHITQIVFGEYIYKDDFDAILVFGNTKIQAYQKTYEIFQRNNKAEIFITGGNKVETKKHFSWNNGEANEADVIKNKLIEKGISENQLIIENMSKNSLENVLFIRDSLYVNKVSKLCLITTNYALGRQLRTLKKHMEHIIYYCAPYNISLEIDEPEMTKENWFVNERWQSKVWGEYLRNYYYGIKGDIISDFIPTDKIIRNLNLTTAST